MKIDPESVYKKKIIFQNQKIDKLKKIEIVLICVKLAAVLAGLFILYRITMNYREEYLFFFLSIMLFFGVISLIHEHFINRKIFLKTLISVNEDEIRSLEHQFPGRDQGQAFSDIDHNYVSDLDIFGEKSVYHFINRGETGLGKKRLAEWLKTTPAVGDPNRIRSIQEAVQELRGMVDLRQSIQVLGSSVKDNLFDAEEITGLFKETDPVYNKKILLLSMHVLPVISLTLIVLLFFGIPWWIPLIPVVIQLGINKYGVKKRNRVYALSYRLSLVLKAYSKILAQIEASPFTCSELIKMKKNLEYMGKRASSHIKRLSLIMSFFELRRNEILHPVLNTLFQWDLHCICRIEKWMKKLGSQINKWLDAVGRFEVFSTFACLRFNHPDWSFPRIQEGPFLLKAKALGHFLIHPDERINNDIFLENKGNIMIITGPNMAGKSTFLKTVGVNLALALCGGPVCAEAFTITPVKIYTSMKVSDSLDKNLSLFYAELQRLKMVLDGIKRKEKVFFLLDEMLKGTNALDRQMGAVALLKQLVGLEANGLVATHDLELTKLEKQFPKKIKNFHFDGYVEGEKLLFDYKLKEGRCKSFNALLLMKRIGIDV